MNYLRIEQIQVSNLDTNTTANAIGWSCINLDRGASSATLLCSLVNITDDNGVETISQPVYSWSMILPNNILQAWQSDEVIDDYVLSYSSPFIKVI